MLESNGQVSLRNAEVTDAAPIDRLIRYLDAVHAEARPDLFRSPTGSPRGEDFLTDVLEDPLQNIVVALLTDEIVGYVHVLIKHTPSSSFRVERRYGEIDTVAVRPEAQRRGIGRKLIQAALDWLTSQGIHDHQIAVHVFNEPARRLYERMGFTPSVTLLRRKD